MKKSATFPFILASATFGAVLAGPAVFAEPYEPVANPVSPVPGVSIPPPEVVPGKEYSHELDRSSSVTNLDNEFIDSTYPDDQQNTMWNGQGGVEDTFDYNGAPQDGGGTSGLPQDQVDAIANNRDTLFFPAVNNQSAILFSTRVGSNIPGQGADGGAENPQVPEGGCTVGDPICFERLDGSIATWATWTQVDQFGGTNLDALEIWGPEGVDNANLFSLFDDFSNGCSVWGMAAPGSQCLIPQSDIAALFPSLRPEQVDIDALMVSGNWLMFSLWPVAGTAEDVGDSVWVWQIGTSAANPLNHGGHLWINGWLGLNVDALEAASTPELDAAAGSGGLGLLAGTLALMGERRRRRQRS